MWFEGTLALSQRDKAARFRLRSFSLRSETVPAQPSYDLLHHIPLALHETYHGKKDAFSTEIKLFFFSRICYLKSI